MGYRWEMRPGRVLRCTLDADLSESWEGSATELIDELAKTSLEAKVCVLEVRPLSGRVERLYVAWEVMYPSLPEAMVEALKEADPLFALQCVWAYVVADEDARLDISSFYDSQGPDLVRQVRLRNEEGIPTAEDLRRALEGVRPANRCPVCNGDAETRVVRVKHDGSLLKVLECGLGHRTEEGV